MRSIHQSVKPIIRLVFMTHSQWLWRGCWSATITERKNTHRDVNTFFDHGANIIVECMSLTITMIYSWEEELTTFHYKDDRSSAKLDVWAEQLTFLMSFQSCTGKGQSEGPYRDNWWSCGMRWQRGEMWMWIDMKITDDKWQSHERIRADRRGAAWRLARLVVGLRNQPGCGVKHAVHQA